MGMRTVFIIGTVVVLGCSLWVSFNHTLDLFRAGGFTYGLEWGVTIAAETSFLMGVLSRFNSRLKGTKPYKEANFMFIVGLLVVGWSNWESGAAHGVQGIIKGLLVPIFIYGSESVLAREYIEWKKKKEKFDQSSDQATNQPDSETGDVSTSATSTSETGDTSTNITTTNEVGDITNEVGDTATKVDTTTNEVGDTTEETDTTTKADATTNETDTTTNEADSVTTKADATSTKVDATNETDATTKVDDATTTNEEDFVTTTTNETDTNKEKKDRRLRLVKPDEEPDAENDGEPDLEYIKKKAKEYFKENGEWPGRKRLMRLAGCREHPARRALDELKGKAS